MRRSAAPSQQGLAPKRPRFNPPFRSSNPVPIGISRPLKGHPATSPRNQSQSRTLQSASSSKDEDSTAKVKEHSNMEQLGETSGNSELSDSPAGKTLQQAPRTHCEKIPGRTSVLVDANAEDTGERQPQSQEFAGGDARHEEGQRSTRVETNPQNPQPKRSVLQRKPFMVKQTAPTIKTPSAETEDDDGPKRHYYSVMWCKLSKKKHKKWEGDALLITKGRSVTLLDVEGKEIGKGSGYRPSELESMAEGHTLCVGGKEIEVMGSISQEDWTTGKCFQTGSSSSSTSISTALPSARAPRPSKPFANPQKTGDGSSALQAKVVQPRVARPLYDPTHPDALVMPRPPSSHQWQNNQQDESVVDVVIDPHLVSKLRPHQRQGVLFLYECIMGLRQYQGNGAILADEMGLGKTLQCITLIWTLFKQGPYGGKPVIKRVLIVTPGSLVKNWCREFRKWLGSERISVFPVSSDKKVEEFKKSPLFPVMVISYEMMVRYADDIRAITFDLVVCDEGHRLKNSNIKTASLLSSLAVRRRILLTGTPVQNDLQEFYSIVEFCNPGVLGTSGSFHRVYEEPILRSNQPSATKEEKVLGAARATELSRLTSLFVLRRTQEINNKYLPPKVETVVFCRPSSLQLRLYQHLLRSPLIRSCLTRGYATSSSAGSPHLVCIGALKKLCNDPSLLYQASKKAGDDAGEKKGGESWLMDDDEEEESLYKGLLPLYPHEYRDERPLLDHCGKLCVLSEMLRAMHADQNRRERLVLVSNYTQTLDILQALCSMEGYQFCRLDGSTPTAKRQSIVEHFNSSYAKETIFLLSSKAGGVGLNLIGASRLLLYDIDWNPANDLQAMARVWRDGQKKTVHIYRLITAGTIEEKIYQRQISKQSLSGAVVDAKGHSSTVKFSQEDLRDLFTLHEGSACITHDMLDCDCTGTSSVLESTEDKQRDLNRPCQLGRPQPVKLKKNLSMGDLNEWKHYSTPLSQDFQDEYLLEAGEKITFVFQNETNMAPFAS